MSNSLFNEFKILVFDQATFGNIDTSLYTFCELNEDCIHVPSCPLSRVGRKVLLPANKNYVAECQGAILCNNKCRCENQEFDLPTKKQNVFASRTAYCIDSKCVSRYSTYAGRRQPVDKQILIKISATISIDIINNVVIEPISEGTSFVACSTIQEYS